MSRGVPTAIELVRAVAELLRHDVVAGTDGELAFHARVAAHALGIVERELAQGARVEAAHANRLEALGVADESALANAIRNGGFDGREHYVVEALHARAIDLLAIDNPRYLAAPD